jgi:two-component system cell cycle sensor histidine kinase/response regulator CckA
MKEATRPSKRFNKRASAGISLEGAEKILNTDGDRQAVTHEAPHDRVASGDCGESARPELYMSHSQHVQITQAVLDQAVLGVAFVGLDSRIQYANRALAGLLRYKQEELKGVGLGSLMGGPGGAQALLQGTTTPQAEQPEPPAASCLTRKTGDTVACLIDSRAIHDENGKTAHFLVFISPAPPGNQPQEFSQIESELYRSQGLQTLGTLAGGVAHDFNNALEVILGFTSLAQLRLSPEDPLHEPLKIIEESAKGAAGLARRLLDVSKDNPDDPRPVEAGDLVGTVLSIITRTFDRKIRIEHRIGSHLPLIKGNRNRLQQAILNLCINARDAMEQGGTLSIEAGMETLQSRDARLPESSPPGQYVRIAIRDTGEGIPPEIMERIFVPLFTTKGSGRGHGLGLTMVQKVVSEAQGFISVASTPGEGSDFSLYFPAISGQQRQAMDSRRGQMLSGRGRVLVVDDEPRVLQFLEKGLTRLGYEVLTAESGHRACEIYSRKSAGINCVLLDLIMPGLSGLETYARLKDINPRVRVILSSGYSSGRIRREASESGSPEFLEKPYTLEELSQALQKFQNN